MSHDTIDSGSAPSPPPPPARRSLLRLGLAAFGLVILAAMASPSAWWVGEPAPQPVERADNAIWLRRRWLHESPSNEEIVRLAAQLHAHGIPTIYPFVGPMKPGGRFGWREGEALAEYDGEGARSFLTRVHAAAASADRLRVLPWTGGVLGRDAFPEDPAWRADFVAQAKVLVDLGADGIHVNIEPMPEGTPGYLDLLRELKLGLGPEKLVSVAAYPPPTPLHPYADVHWSPAFLRSICAAADDVSVMAYDTALATPEAYAALVTTWTQELTETLDSGRGAEPRPSCTWRIGVPTYEDDKPWHRPEAETLSAALDGVLRANPGGAANFAGLAVYASWTTDAAEWADFDTRWRGGPDTDGEPIDPP